MTHTFSVAAMMHEDAETIEVFCQYYSRLGAKEIFLYLDDCTFASSDPKVRIADWTDYPANKLLKTKQVEAYQDAFGRTEADWIAMIDADEFIFSDVEMSELLEKIPRTVDVLRLPTAEAVWGPGDDMNEAYGCSHFRTRIGNGGIVTKLITFLVYGPSIYMLFPKGLAGHTGGKSILRVGRDVGMIRLHAPWKDGKRSGVWTHELGIRNAYIVHFDAISLDRWTKKWSRRLSQEAVTIDVEGRNAQSEDLSRKRFSKLYGLNRIQFLALRAIGRGFTKNQMVTGRKTR